MPNRPVQAREAALGHLEAALATGIRGDMRTAINQAIDIALGKRVVDVTDLEYRKLAPGAKLLDPNRSGLLMRHGKRTGRVWVYRFDDPATGKRTELQFGHYPTMSVIEARETWQELRE